MVLIDGVKYACHSCVKGHRSSKCSHTTRTLVEIKKKGRPTSQCSHCRDLRKTRAVHGRCDCAARETEERPKAKVLHNGIADIPKESSVTPEASTSLADAQGVRVQQILNSCSCRRGGKCSCCSVLSRSVKAAKAEAPSTPALSDSPSSPTGSCSSRTDTPLSNLAMPPQPNPLFYYPAPASPFNPYVQQQQQQQQQQAATPQPQDFYPFASTSHIPNGYMPPPNPYANSTTPCHTPPLSGFSPSFGPATTPTYASPFPPAYPQTHPSPYLGAQSYFPQPPPPPQPFVPPAQTMEQLQAAHAAGMTLEELMRNVAQGCGMNPVPMGWGGMQQQQPGVEMMGYAPPAPPTAMTGMENYGLPPLPQIWGSSAGTAQAEPMFSQGELADKQQWTAPYQQVKRKATLPLSPTFTEPDPRTPPAPLWTGGLSTLSAATSPPSSAGPSHLSLNFDDMNLESFASHCGRESCDCAPVDCHCILEKASGKGGAEGDIEELAFAAPPCRGMKMQPRVQSAGDSMMSYSSQQQERPSRRRKVMSPLAIEIVPEPSAASTTLAPAPTPASYSMLSPSFDDFNLSLDQLTAEDIEGFGKPYEESAADTLAATGGVLESPKMGYLQMAELIAAGFC